MKVNLHRIDDEFHFSVVGASGVPVHVDAAESIGVGWSITGACPGPILAQIGSGAYPALFTFAGALFEANIYYMSKEKLPH